MSQCKRLQSLQKYLSYTVQERYHWENSQNSHFSPKSLKEDTVQGQITPEKLEIEFSAPDVGWYQFVKKCSCTKAQCMHNSQKDKNSKWPPNHVTYKVLMIYFFVCSNILHLMKKTETLYLHFELLAHVKIWKFGTS